MRERSKRTIIRKIENGEITFSRSKKAFVYQDTEEEYKIDNRDDDEDDDDFSDSDEEPSQKKKGKKPLSDEEEQEIKPKKSTKK